MTERLSPRELIEQLAAIEHERWADWQRYLHNLCDRRDDGALVIPASHVQRWERQISTSYDYLTDLEKDSDRAQVARYWPLIERLERERDEARAEAEKLAKDLKQANMLERMAHQHATRCDANVAEVDARLADAKADLALMRATEPEVYYRVGRSCGTTIVAEEQGKPDRLMGDMKTKEDAARVVAALNGDESDQIQLIRERDRAEERLDRFVEQVERLTGQDLGEHSSANDPPTNALEALTGLVPLWERYDLQSWDELLAERDRLQAELDKVIASRRRPGSSWSRMVRRPAKPYIRLCAMRCVVCGYVEIIDEYHPLGSITEEENKNR